MTTDTVRLMAAYNAYADRGMGDALAKLDAETWTKDFGGFFGSIKALCDHIYRADLAWLGRFSALRPFKATKNPLVATPLPRDVEAFSTAAEYVAKQAELDTLISAFAAELSDEDLAADLGFKNRAGEAQAKNFGGLWLHLFNHATHHRGAVAIYLDIAGIENDFSNLLRIL